MNFSHEGEFFKVSLSSPKTGYSVTYKNKTEYQNILRRVKVEGKEPFHLNDMVLFDDVPQGVDYVIKFYDKAGTAFVSQNTFECDEDSLTLNFQSHVNFRTSVM
jgi:hypothetical protein